MGTVLPEGRFDLLGKELLRSERNCYLQQEPGGCLCWLEIRLGLGLVTRTHIALRQRRFHNWGVDGVLRGHNGLKWFEEPSRASHCPA